jgi:hypothetical protein
MAKAKPKSRIMVADGDGGMIRVEDRRFEHCAWPIVIEVPVERAENWFRYLQFECECRGWSSAGMSQLEPRENSGSQTLLAAGAEQLSITWDRIRGGMLNVRARPAATLGFAEAQEFFRNLTRRSSAGATEPVWRWGTLEYEGRAWRGELWLSERLRLGPPSAQYERAVFGPRAVIVDAVVDCISQGHSAEAHRHLHEELSAFLSVVTYRDGGAPGHAGARNLSACPIGATGGDRTTAGSARDDPNRASDTGRYCFNIAQQEIACRFI